jgi:RimJ/RimL family protein N-acetyltransferase
VFLRALDSHDIDQTLRWHNDPELYSNLVGGFRHVSATAERAWLSERSEFSMRDVSLAICLTADRSHIGNAYIREIDWVSRTAEAELFIGPPEHRGKGNGGTSLALLQQHARSDLGLRRLSAFVLSENTRSVALFLSGGFRKEGLLREQAFKDGKYRDVVCLGWLAGDDAGPVVTK